MIERPRILCIEDNAVNWRLASRLLGQAGFECHWADEGLKGFDMALALRPDMVLLDINLPGLSGYEVAAKFRNHPELASMKIVALTAKTLKSERETALVAGCDGFIPKPIDPFTFVRQVSDYLGGHRDQVEREREGAVLRQLNTQVLEHLEAQLREAQQSNLRLIEAQAALEARNRSMSRLFSLGRTLLSEHKPDGLLLKVAKEMVAEFQTRSLRLFRLNESRGYFQGLAIVEGVEEPLMTLSVDHPFVTRLRGAFHHGGSVLSGEGLKGHRLWEEGVAGGLWSMNMEPCLVQLKERKEGEEVVGIWALERTQPWMTAEQEALALYASLTVVHLENAELIDNLNQSSRALASSYERMELAYQDLQKVKEDLVIRRRQALLSELFQKMATRLESPVSTLRQELHGLSSNLAATPEGAQSARSIAAMMEALVGMDGLLKALARRTRKEGEDVPEWLSLHQLFQQEIELLHVDLGITDEVEVTCRLEGGEPMILGVYGDFATILSEALRNALPVQGQTRAVQVHTWVEEGIFHLDVADDGGPIPPSELASAFDPFNLTHEPPVLGVRAPSKGMVVLSQILTSYHGNVSLENQGDGLRLHCWFPLR